MRSVLITGGAGFFGQAFVRHLLNPLGPHRICVYSRSEWAQAQMRTALGDDDRLRWFIGDVRDTDRLERAMAGCDAVVHAAALKRIETVEYNVMEAVATNVVGSENVIKAAISTGVRKVVLLSTDKAVEPTTTYGLSKAMAERLFINARHYAPTGPQFIVCRYGNVAGSTGSVIPIWRKLIAGGEANLPITDPDCTRFWMTAQQAVDMVVGAIDHWMEDGVMVPKELPAYRLGDLAAAMGHGWRSIPMAGNEKMHERLIEGGPDSSQVRRMSVQELKEALEHI